MFDISEKVILVNNILDEILPASEHAGSIEEAVRYSVLNGGKRLRPIMLLEAFRLFCADKETEKLLAYPFAAAMECIHSYSLVHDDLPAMDNDTYRRGNLTTHKKYGHAMGILAGDALLNLSFEIMSKAAVDISNLRQSEIRDVLNMRAARAMHEITKRSGYSGMIFGQVRDCKENTPVTEEEIVRTYELKTSYLFEAALCAGAVLGGADEAQVETVKNAGYHIGIAFQLRDDILDETADFEELGKDVGSDARNEKKTYCAVFGMENTRNKLAKEIEAAKEAIEKLPAEHKFFIELCDYLTV